MTSPPLTLHTVPEPLSLLCAAAGESAVVDDDNLRGELRLPHWVLPHQLAGQAAAQHAAGRRGRVSTVLRL